MLILIAGADTTGTAFQSMIYHVLTNKEVYNKLIAEIDSASTAGLIGDVPQYKAVMEHCPYYVACVKETLRLEPSVRNIMPRLVGKDGMEIDGRYIPEGIEVACAPWLV